MEEIEVEGAAEGYVELFNRQGVDYVFSSPGTEFVPIWEYLVKYKYSADSGRSTPHLLRMARSQASRPGS